MEAKSSNDGGADEDRTRYLVVANDALSQMSYSPKIATQDYQKKQQKTIILTHLIRIFKMFV